jgi:hypothetical protein
MTARLAADSSRGALVAAEVGGGGGTARQAETRPRRDGASRTLAPAPALPSSLATGATARKEDWTEFMAGGRADGELRCGD